MINSILSKNAGFYSQFFFLVNHYLHAKKNNLNFKVHSDDWLFKYKNGWEDYFKYIDINTGIVTDHQHFSHFNVIEDFKLSEYKTAIQQIYNYNDCITEKILITKNQLTLKSNYDAIFIRRGDKLCEESNFVCTEKYIEILLNKNPDCHTIFVQTDDYNCYLDVKNYVNDHNLSIDVVTLCDENNKGGMIIISDYKRRIELALNEHSTNKYYISTVIDNLRSKIPIDQLNDEELYKHTTDMLIGIQIVLESNIVVCDYSSNVSRFIKLAHKNSDNVFELNNPDNDINWNRTICPAFCF